MTNKELLDRLLELADGESALDGRGYPKEVADLTLAQAYKLVLKRMRND